MGLRNSKLEKGVSRVGGVFGGLWFTLLPGVFVVAGLWITIQGLTRAFTWPCVQAKVLQVELPTAKTARIRVVCEFAAGGPEACRAEMSADPDSDEKRFNRLQSLKTGDTLPIYYDPADPSNPRMEFQSGLEGLSFTIFALPFLAIGLTMLLGGLTGKEIVPMRQVGSQGGDHVPGGSWFLGFVGICVAATVLNIVQAQLLPLSLAIFVSAAIFATPFVYGGYVIRRLRRKPDSPRQDSIAAIDWAANPAAGSSAPRQPMGTLKKQMLMIGGFAFFWCGLTGVFVGLAAVPLWQSFDAQQRFKTTNGQVVASRVKTTPGDENDTYRPIVEFTYSVDGKDYASKRFGFDGAMSSSDSSYANRAVSSNPPGKKVKVYYDPDDPSRAVLDVQPQSTNVFLALFLQPFILVGLGLIVALVTTPSRRRRTAEFLAGRMKEECPIPSWGMLRRRRDSITVSPKGGLSRWLLGLVMGYGLTCFLTIFPIAFFVLTKGGDAIPWVIRAFKLAGGVGLFCMLVAILKSGKQSLDIDLKRRTIKVGKVGDAGPARLDDYTTWQLREVAYGHGIKVNDSRLKHVLLSLVGHDGRELEVHRFKPGHLPTADELQAVAMQTRQVLSQLTGIPQQPDIIRMDQV